MSPRVLHVVRSDSFSGVERYICDVAGELHRRGWEVGVIGGHPVTMTAELGSIELREATTTAQAIGALRAVGRADIVHAHMTAAELAAVTTRPLTRARVVATRHFAERRGSSPLARTVGRFIRTGVSGQIAISRYVADRIGEPAVVIPNGVPVAEPVLVGREPFVLVMQRHQPEKHTEVALQAWAACAARARGWRLQIAGRGALTEQLREESHRLAITETVDFLGFVDDPVSLMRRASIFLATAPREPFGLAVVEAMSHGTPVVAAAGGAHLETVGDAGVLFEPGDGEACARAIDEMADDAAHRAHLGDAAVTRQRARFSLGAHADALVEYYEKISRVGAA